MNKIKSKIIGAALLLAAVVLVALKVQAAPTLVVGNLLTVPVTGSNSVPFLALNYNPASQLITVTHGALTSTNEAYIAARFTFDQVNFFSNTVVWYPSFTNPATEYIPANYFALNPYMQLCCATTNTIQYGASYGQ